MIRVIDGEKLPAPEPQHWQAPGSLDDIDLLNPFCPVRLFVLGGHPAGHARAGWSARPSTGGVVALARLVRSSASLAALRFVRGALIATVFASVTMAPARRRVGRPWQRRSAGPAAAAAAAVSSDSGGFSGGGGSFGGGGASGSW